MDPRLTVIALLALAACSPDTPKQPEPSQKGAPAAGPLPEQLIVTTNEPSRSAEIRDGRILLRTPDKPDGEWHPITAVASSRTAGSARRSWSGPGITVEADSAPCRDSMSGAAFPYSGAITLGSTRTPGCARPAGTPPPVEPGA